MRGVYLEGEGIGEKAGWFITRVQCSTILSNTLFPSKGNTADKQRDNSEKYSKFYIALKRRDKLSVRCNIMAKFFENFTITLLYLAMAWLEFGGIWHAADKHSTNDTLVAIFVPPYAWYRSIEFFWHDDFANVDWEKRLVGDMETCVYILDYSVSEQLEPMKLNDGIELFLDSIANYPPEKIE